MREINVGDAVGPVACRSCDLFEICSAIDAIPASSGLPRCPTLRVVEAGEVLYTAGSPAHHVYALRKGMVKSERVAPANNKRVIALHVPGEVLGEEGMRAGRYTSTVTAIGSAMFCELPFRGIASWDSKPLQSGIAALAETKHPPVSRLPRRAQDRLNNFARDLVSRLQSRGMAPREIAIDMARYELADLLGISIDSLRRALQHAQKGSMVKQRDKRVIVSA